MRNQRWYRTFIWLAFGASLLILAYLAPTLSKPEYIPVDDFVRYWAAGRLNLNGDNPYDPALIEQLQTEAGGQAPESGIMPIMLNPPWALPLTMLFGWLDYPLSRLAWLMVNIALLLLCAEALWNYYDCPRRLRWVSWLVVFLFAPTISVLEKGQITPILLVGITGFIYFTEKRPNAWLAGISLALTTIKPQLIYLFGLSLLLWIIQKREWKVLVRAIACVFTLGAIAVAFNPSVYAEYIYAMRFYPTSEWATPTIGTHLRYWIDLDKTWLQLIPLLIGFAFLARFRRKQGTVWDWHKETPWLLMVSLATTPYAWTYDLVLLAPALVQVVSWLLRDKRRWHNALILGFLAILSALDLYLHRFWNDFWFVWLAPSLLAWYVWVYLQRTKTLQEYAQ